MAASTTDVMNSTPEAVMAVEEPPSLTPSHPHTETKVEQVDDDIAMAQSLESPVTQTQAGEEPAESSPLLQQKPEGSPSDEAPSPDHTTSPVADASYASTLNGDHSKNNAINKLEIPQENKLGVTADDTVGTNEVTIVGISDDGNDNNEEHEELTPPPDSPIEDTMSHSSSVPPNALQDEIVVGHNAHNRASPARVIETEDVIMGDAEETPPIIQPTKRKRASGVYAESVGDKVASPTTTEDLEVRRPIRPAKSQSVGATKGVLIGYWRDSPAENEADKHAVVGFIDVRDRLRTRIQPTTREGRPMDQRYPIPPGPGGSWVTFDKVAFDPHLVGHNHHVIKEYVKIRAEDNRKDETPEERAKLNAEAAESAAEKVRANPPPDAPTAPLIAYGPEIPANAVLPNRPENKKRRLAGSFGVPSESPKPARNPLDDIPGKRPTSVLVGYWKHSSEDDPINKHAVFGVLGANDMFRVKLSRETRDGRKVEGNFPSGAGALWIHWDEVMFDPHLRKLSRNEIKEYCRVRQRQMDDGELPAHRVANETKAVYEAQQRVVQSLAMMSTPTRRDDSEYLPLAMKGSATANGTGRDSGSPASSLASARPAEELRQSRRLENGPRAAATAAGRHPLPDIEYRPANRPVAAAAPNPAALERTNSLARREIARLEAAQARADMRAASREASLAPAAAPIAPAPSATASTGNVNGGGVAPSDRFLDNVSRLNRVWEAQEANRLRASGDDDAKMHMGVKYSRKQSGPFQGKLVSQGMIITIDGEDYVEYRVLTKPTFF